MDDDPFFGEGTVNVESQRAGGARRKIVKRSCRSGRLEGLRSASSAYVRRTSSGSHYEYEYQ